MELARVEGTIVSTAKTERLKGYKLLLLNLVEPDLKPTKNFLVAVDSVGAGEGEVVIVVRGSSARQVAKLSNVPTDASIVGIVDTVEHLGITKYKKNGWVDLKLAKVTGKVWSTIKDEKLNGIILYIIQPMDENMIPFGKELVAIDTVGALENDLVYWVGGGEATLVYKGKQVPSDVSIVGLVDRVDL